MGASSALIFGVLINVAILLVFFRFLMQLAAVSPYNPVVLSTMKATKIVDLFSRSLPTIAKGRQFSRDCFINRTLFTENLWFDVFSWANAA